MRALCQRVRLASVTIREIQTATIGKGLLIFLGIEESDGIEDIEWLAGKITRLRIFQDSDGQMNLGLKDISGEALVVSQFTLHASTKKGNRPSLIRAARPEQAEPIYQSFVQRLSNELGHPVSTGQFGADMLVSLQNDGPVTIWIDSKNRE